ncbi:MAG: hypothetical protein FJW36_23595 [Acidobacteria bacterium]|nr:hypothetical protein [Acidobacteriota bacterium]
MRQNTNNLLRIPFIFGLLAGQVLCAQDTPKREFYGLTLGGFQNQGLGLKDLKDAKEWRFYDGFAVGYVEQCTRRLGLKLEFSGLTDKQSVGNGANRFAFRQSNWWFLGGVQMKASPKESSLRPFAHALIGASILQTSTSAAEKLGCAGVFGLRTCPSRFDENKVRAAISIGGGLDVRIGKRLEFRVAQVEYMPMCHSGSTYHNVRIGMGLVFH